MNDMYGPEAQLPVDININMAKVMGVFLAQLRLVPVCLLLYTNDSICLLYCRDVTICSACDSMQN